MTTTMPTLIDQLGEAALAAKDVVREAHEAIKDLRGAVREAREAEASLRRELAQAASLAAAEALDAALLEHTEQIGADLRALVERAVEGEARGINDCLRRIARAAGVPPVLLVREPPA